MKTIPTILIVLTLLTLQFKTGAEPATEPVTNAPTSIELYDQFHTLQKLDFPTTRITLLTIADGEGSQQISAWVKPVRQRFDARVDIRGIADMSCVPRPLRGLVRRQFRAVQSYPVMLDWKGDTVKAFGYAPGEADILVLDHYGKILYRTRGKADPQAIQDLCEVIQRKISTEPPPTPPK